MKNRIRISCCACFGLVLAGNLNSDPVASDSLPRGGEVVAGEAVFDSSVGSLDVVQGSEKAIINWDSFDIGESSSVVFYQPGADAVVLNRVLGSDPTSIFGTLQANGQVFVLNPSGVVFGETASVDVGGLVASTLELSDFDFLNGDYAFEQGDGGGVVLNQGQLSSNDGYIALFGQQVLNEGVIQSEFGSVSLASGDAITMSLDGNRLLSVKVDEDSLSELGKDRQIVRSGSSSALITGSASKRLVDAVVPVDSPAANDLVVGEDGSIRLVASTGSISGRSVAIDAGEGNALLGGSIDVSDTNGAGGDATVLGETVMLGSDASIAASGLTGGGQVKVGGSFQGKDAGVRNATRTRLLDGATIDSSAVESGDGGQVVVWSDDFTSFAGDILARGGSDSGDGGFVEVSGKRLLDYGGLTNLLAENGEAGTLLLDPRNVTIQTAGPDSGYSTDFIAESDDSILTVATLQTALGSGNVSVTTGATGAQTGDITVANALGWFGSNTLTLEAANDILLNADIQTTGGLTLTADSDSSNAGGVTLGSGAKVELFGGNLTVDAYDDISDGDGYFNIGGTSTFTSTNGSLLLDSASNVFSDTVTATAGNAITIVNVGDLLIGNISAGAGGVDLSTSSAGSITSSGTFASTGEVTLAADGVGGVSIADLNGDVGFESISAGGAITLGNADTGALTFDSASGNVITGNSSSGAASGAVTIEGNSIAINDPVRTRGGSINLTSDTTVSTTSTADLTTTADANTGTASGSVTVSADSTITLQNVTTTGAANDSGVGSNAAAVTLTSTNGDINVGAITTTGGAAVAGATTNRNGGNAGNIILTASNGTMHLNGDLNAIGGGYVGTASQGPGGYIELGSDAMLEGNRTISSGGTSGDVYFLGTIDSDDTSRSLSVTAGSGDVLFDGTVGGSAPLSSLTVSSADRTDIEENVTTNGAAGVDVTSYTTRLGDDGEVNGAGSIVINTESGNGVVDINSTLTYLDDAVTFTRGTGAIDFSHLLYSNDSERNDLTFNGASGGSIDFNYDVGGTSASPNTKLGDILVETVTDLTFDRYVSAASLVSLNGTGRFYNGGSDYQQYFDGASGYQIQTTGTHDNFGSDENITSYPHITVSDASAPISIVAPNGSVTLNNYGDLTTAGGDITVTGGNGYLTVAHDVDMSSSGGDIRLKAAAGLLSIDNDTDILSSNGLISLTGIGVDQNVTNNVINAGSGKIRIDGGGSYVELYGRLITSDSDSSGTPSILVSNVGGGGNAARFRSVESQTGTFQVGLIAGEDNLVAAQDPGGAADLALTTEEIRLRTAQQVTLTSVGDDSGVTFTITGTDAVGDPLVENISGGNAGAVTTTGSFKTIASIATDADTDGNVSVGLAADDSVDGSLYQYTNSSYSDNQIDIKTLSAATTGAISITSTSNVIDQLGDFSVGSSLDVRARGRAAGMELTGDVAATSVTIKTGNGPLVLGDRNITSTSGDINLQGTGITQTSGSVVDSADQVLMYGYDYSNSNLLGNIDLAGSIVAANTGSESFYVYSSNDLTLGNVTLGTLGNRGGLRLGYQREGNSSTSYDDEHINGTISQTSGTAILANELEIHQGYDETGDVRITADNNEIGILDHISVGGSFYVYDKDGEGNGLTNQNYIGYDNYWGYTGNIPVFIETEGAFVNSSSIYGEGIYLSGSSITNTGNLFANYGSAGDLILQANGGAVTLSGTTRVDGAGNDLIIRNASDVQLGTVQYLDGDIVLGSAGTAAAVATSQAVGGAGNLTLDGSATGGGTATFTMPERVAITSAGTDTGITFTVTGTDVFGRPQVEVITGSDAATATGSEYFATVTQIAASGAAAGNVTIGTALENITGDVTQTGSLDTDFGATLVGLVDGSVTLTSTGNDFGYVGDLAAGGDISLVSQANNILHVSGDVVSNTGDINISNYNYHLYVDSSGSVTGSAADSQVTLRANTNNNGGYDVNLQGPVSSGTGGIVIDSTYGDVYTSGLGTLSSTGGVTIDSDTGHVTSIGAAVSSGANGIDINSGGNFSNTAAGTLTSTGEITIDTTNGYSTTINGAISAGEGGNNNIQINSGSTFVNNSGGTLTATGFVGIETYWDGVNERNLTVGDDITAGLDGVRLTSSGTINQTGGVITTTGTLSGPNQSGGTPTYSLPSARGAITLTADNEIANLGPFYLRGDGSDAINVKDVSGGLTLAGTIENSLGDVTLSTEGGALNLATYDVYAGGMATGGADIALTGQGISQSAGSDINTTGGTDGTPRTGANGGGTITLTGHDGSSAGNITLAGGISTVNASTSAIKIRGTGDLQLPDVTAASGTLVLGDDTVTIGQITGNVTQATNTAINVNALKLGTASNAIGGSAVITGTNNLIGSLDVVNVSDTVAQYDLDIFDSRDGLNLTQDVISAGGARIITETGAGSDGILALSEYDVLASGDIFLGGDTITQTTNSVINADNSGGGATGGSIRIDGGGGSNNLTLEGTITTDNSSSTAVEIVNATNAILNVVSAANGTVTLGENTKELSGAVTQTATTGVISAATLAGDAGSITVETSNLDNVGPLTTATTLTLQDQGGSGTAGLKFVGNVATGGSTLIETTDGILDLDTYDLDATGQGITLKGVGVSQQAASSVYATTADLYGSTGDIDLFSATNDFTGQVTTHSTGTQVSVQDANQLSMNALTGVLDPSTSVRLWAGTQLALTSEDLTTTSGNIEFRSLGGILNTPGHLTTGSGDISLFSSTTLTLAEKIDSTSGDIAVEGNVIASRAGAGDYIKTGGAGTIDITANTGNFTQGSDVLFQTVDGDISITALGGNMELANIQSTNGGLYATAGGNIQQLSGKAITVDTIDALTQADAAGDITLTGTGNDANKIRLRTLNDALDTTVGGVIQFNDADDFAVQEILTTADATLTAHGDISTDTTDGDPGTVTAETLTVKTLLDAGAGVALDNANDVNTLNVKVRNSADDAIAGETSTPTGTVRFTDTDGFVITAIETGGSTVLTAGDTVTQTGAVKSAKLGLSGAGGYTLNLADNGNPVNEISTFASDATGNVNLSSQLALSIGAVNPTGITSDGADVTISAPSIDSSGSTIDTTSSSTGTAGGSVSLTTTGTGAAGNLTTGDIVTSGSAAAVASGNGGGAAGDVTLTASGETLSVAGTVTARGGAGDGAGVDGADGTVKLFATSGAVSQADGSTELDVGRVLVDAANASSLLDTDNAVDQVAARLTGAGQSFTYRSGTDYEIGGGEGGVTGITTAGGAIDLDGSDVAVSVSQAIITKGGALSANGVRSFDSSGVTINTAGDITYASGVYKDGGDITVVTSANGGAVTTGTLIASGDIVNAGDATSGAVTLDADGTLTTSTINAQGKGSGAGGATTLTGSLVRIGGSVDASSTAAAGGNISIVGPAQVYNSNRVLATGSGGGNVSFSDTLDSDGTARGLSITAGTGDVTFSGAIGNSSALSDLTIVSATDVDVTSTLDAATYTQQAGTGATTLDGVVTLSGNFDYAGLNLNLNQAANVGGTMTVTNAGVFTTAAAGDISAVSGFTQDGAGANSLLGDISTTNTGIRFSSAVTVNDAISLDTDTGVGNIQFDSTVDSEASEANQLTMAAGGGNIILSGPIGSGVNQELGNIVVSSANNVTTFSTIEAANLTQSAGTGTTTLGDTVTLSGNLDFTGSALTVNAGLDTGGSVDVTNAGTFTSASAGDITAATGFTQDGAGINSLEGDISTTNTGISFATGVTLAGAVALDTDAGAGDITFSDTVDSEASEGNALTMSAGTGSIALSGAVGSGLNQELGAIQVNSANNVTASSTVEAASFTQSAGTGTTTLQDTTTLSGDFDFTGNALTVNAALDSGGSVGVTNAGTFTTAVAGDIVADTGFTQNGAGSNTLSGDITTTNSAISFDTAVTLNDAVALDTGAGAGSISFANTVNSQTAEQNALTLTAGTGDITFTGSAGTTQSLGTVDINSAADVGIAAITAEALNQSAGSGTTTLDGAVNVTTDAGITLTGTNLAVNQSVTTTNSGVVTINESGTAVFADAANIDADGAVSITAGGGITTDADVTTTGDDITFVSASILNDAVNLDTGVGAGSIAFSSTVDSQTGESNGLTLTAGTGNIDFTGAAGSVDRLGAIDINSATNVTAAGITAGSLNQDAGSGTTTLNGAVDTDAVAGVTLTGTNLAINQSITTTNGGVVTVNESGTLALAAAGDIAADGAVSLTAAGGITTSGDVSTTDDTITYASATVLEDAVALDSNDAAITFSSALDSATGEANNLTMTAGTGSITFDGTVGATDALGTVRVDSAGTVTANNSFVAQNLGVIASGNVTLSNAGNNIGVLAAELSSDGSLTLTDVNGLIIGTIGVDPDDINGISDGAGTSNVSLTLGGVLIQFPGAVVSIDGNLTIDTSAYDAGDVTFRNINADGTVLDDTLIGRDFTLDSTGDITQDDTKYLRVGGAFETPTGSFIPGFNSDNFLAGGSGAVVGNEVRLFGVITLSMSGNDLVATDDSMNSVTVADGDLNSGVQIISDAGGESITGVSAGVDAVILDDDNQIGGLLKITTRGTYNNLGGANATGIIQSTALDVEDISLVVQDSTENATSLVAGAGDLILDNASNLFNGTLSISASGFDAVIDSATDLELGNIGVNKLTLDSAQNLTQLAGAAVVTDELLLLNADSAVLANGNNRIGTLAANMGGTGILNLSNNQALIVGSIDATDGVTNAGAIQLTTTAGALTLTNDVESTATNAGVTLAGADGISMANVTLDSGDLSLTANNGDITESGNITGVSTLSASASGEVTLDGSNTLATLGSVTAGTGITVEDTTGGLTIDGNLENAAGDILVHTEGGQLVLADTRTIEITGTGDLILAAGAGEQFINQSTALGSPLTLADGRFLIYSDDHTTHSSDIGNISGGTVYMGFDYATNAPGTIGGADSRVLYNTQATLMVTANDLNRYYGEANPTLTYVITGYLTGDNAGSSFTGTPSLSTTALQTDNVNDFTISSAVGTLASSRGYLFDFTDGTLSITQRPVDLGGTRVYDGTDVFNTGDLGLSNMAFGETLGLSGTAQSDSANVGAVTFDPAGLTLINGTGLASNYTFTGGTHAGTITPYVVDLSGSRVYDGTTDASASDLVLGALVGTETLTLSGTGTAASANVGTRTVDTTGLSLGNDTGLASNYTFVGGTQELSITPFVVSLDGTRIYDGTTDIANSVLSTGSLAGTETLAITGAGSIADGNVSDNKTLNLDTIALADGTGLATNYTLTGGTHTVDVTPYVVDVSGTRVYDATTDADAGDLTLGALVGSETLALSGSGTASSKNVGTRTVDTVGLSLGDGTGLASNYTFTGGTHELDITAASLSISGITASNKVYDATTGATIDVSGALYSGLLGSDDVTVSATGLFSDKNVADGKTVNLSSNYSGVDVSNYSITDQTSTSANITPASLVISGITASNKVYDTTTSATVDDSAAVYTGLIGLDNVTVSATGAFQDKNVANNKTVDLTSNYSGLDVDNYTITDQTTTTADITPAAISISGITASNKVYDGTTAATVDDSGAVYSGLLGSDDVTVDATGAFADKHAGLGKTVNLSSSYSGVDVDNYTITDQATTTANISQLALTVTADDQNKTYGEADPSLTYQTSISLVGTDTFTGGLDRALGETVAGGPYAINQGSLAINDGNGGGNYALSYVSDDLTINQRDITLTADTASKTYGDADPALSVSITSGSLGSVSVSDSLADVTGTLDREVGENVGSYDILLGNDGGSTANYNVTYLSNNAAFSIDQRVLSLQGARVYDGTSDLLAGVFNLDNLSGAETLTLTGTGSMADKHVGSNKAVTLGDLALGDGSNGGLASNYTLSGGTHEVDISQLAITLTADAQSKIYGEVDPSLTYQQSIDLVGSDSLSGSLVRVAGENVAAGPFAINQGTVAIDDENGGANYALSYVSDDLTVAPRPIDLAGERIYDGTTNLNSSIFTLGNLVGSETLVVGGAGSMADKHVGEGKAVSLDTLALGNGSNGGVATNYTLIGGTHSVDITPAEVNVVGVIAVDKVYDGTTAAEVDVSSAALVGLVGGDDVGIDSISGSFADKNVGTDKAVATSGFSLVGDDGSNYTLVDPGTLSADITPKTLVVSATGNDKVYDETTAATVTLSDDRVAGDVLDMSYDAAFVDPGVGEGKFISVSGISVTGADAMNYVFNTSTSTFAAITQATLANFILAMDKVYDGTLDALVELNESLFVGKDVTLDFSNALFSDKNVGTDKTVTVTGITLEGADAKNYDYDSSIEITADITPKTLTVGGLAAQGKVYDATAAATIDVGSVNFDGLVAGDELSISATGSFADKNVGADKAVTIVSDYDGADLGNYSIVDQTSGTADITAKAISVNGIAASDKVYDATTAATVDASSATLDGLITGDVVTVAATGAFADKNVGSEKTVTLNSSYGGVDLGNYAITDQATTTASISAKTLTVSGLAAQDKVYDGATDASIDTSGAVFDGLIAGDELTVDASGAFSDKNVGSEKMVTLANSYGGADAGNYSIQDQGTSFADISPRYVDVVYVALDKSYDGTLVAEVIGSSVAFLPGDDVSLNQVAEYSDIYPNKNKPVSITDIALVGSDSSNYRLNQTDSSALADIYFPTDQFEAKSLSVDTINKLRPIDFASISPLSISLFDPSQLSGIDPEILSGMTMDQARVISSIESLSGSITMDQLEALGSDIKVVFMLPESRASELTFVAYEALVSYRKDADTEAQSSSDSTEDKEGEIDSDVMEGLAKSPVRIASNPVLLMIGR